MNAPPAVFGYGSLVNRATHAYAPAQTARIAGWRRAWRYTPHRAGPFLTAVASPGDSIDGLIAAIPGGDWAALDRREDGYDRLPTPRPGVMIYAVPDHGPEAVPFAPRAREAILLSYVDVVFQGYLREFGSAGLDRFVATTDGWDIPIRDDRASPAYPRHQRLSADETARVDAILRSLGACVSR